MTTKQKRKAPPSLGKAGKKFWASVLDEFAFESDHHFKMLEHAGRMLDVAADARLEIEKTGLMVANRFGEMKENAAAAIERQSMNSFRLFCRELALDLEDGPAEHRGPGRPGTRS